MRSKPLPNKDLLHKKYNYDPDTGILTTKRGKPVGSYSKKEKRLITSIKGSKYYVARLVWMYYYGEDPGELVIDHINRDPCDNRIINLRAITQAQNILNNPRCDNPKLCTYHAGAYQAQVTINKVVHYIGRFDTIEKAQAASMSYFNKL